MIGHDSKAESETGHVVSLIISGWQSRQPVSAIVHKNMQPWFTVAWGGLRDISNDVFPQG